MIRRSHEDFSYTLFQTSFGWSGVVWSALGVRRIFLPHRTREGAEKRMAKEFPYAKEERSTCWGLVTALKNYFKGRGFWWSGSWNLPGFSPFSLAVYGKVSQIPYGEVRTYSWVGASLGSSILSRAVGTALGKNPLPILVPCHRVVRKDGDLGGFSAPGGRGLKAKLLQLEGGWIDRRDAL